MNSPVKKLLAALLLFATLGMVQCGMTPLSGGGTETGNPAMLECARAVFAEVDSTELWSVANYLPGGERQLDPNCLLSQQPVVPLGKKVAAASDTLVIVRDSNYLIITIAGYDTVTVIDTLYNNATVVRNRTVYDTVRPVSQEQENSVIILERIVPDTIQTIDTILMSDTLVVPQRDTTYLPLTDSMTVFRVYNQPNATQQIVFRSSAGALISMDMAIPPAPPVSTNPNNINISATASLSRTAELQGTAVFEKYSNADNDGFLFLPDLAGYSGPQFDMYSRMMQPARTLFTGTYTAGNVQNTTLRVLFDAGRDYRIATTVDNRVLSFSRQKTDNGRIAERITYANRAGDSTCIEPMMVVERYPLSGTISGQTVWLNFLNGADSLDQRQNRLSTIAKDIYYRSGNLWKLETQVEVNNPECAPAPLLNGKVTAELFYNNQVSGKFIGTVDKASGKLYGVYTENGVGHRVTYYRSIDWLEWDETTIID